MQTGRLPVSTRTATGAPGALPLSRGLASCRAFDGEIEEDVGQRDEAAAKDQGVGEGFVAVIDQRPGRKPAGHEQRVEACEDRFQTIDESGVGGGDVALPVVHEHVGAKRAGEYQDGEKAQGRRGAEGECPCVGRWREHQGHGKADERNGGKHHDGKMVHVVAGEAGTFKPQDLSGECHGGRDGFQFAAAEAEVSPIHARQNGDPGDDKGAAQEDPGRRPASIPEGHPDGNEQAVALGEKCGS